MKLLRIFIILIIILALAAFCLFALQNDPQLVFFDLLEKWNSTLFWIILIIFGFTVISTLTGLPVLYFSVALGFIMDFLPALTIAIVINLFAIMLTFFMVKKVFSEYFHQKHGKRKVIQKINTKVSRYGFWTIAFSRSIYILPTNIINFSFPLSSISASQYFFGTLIGLLPESLINISAGFLLKHQLVLLNHSNEKLFKIIIPTIFLILMAIIVLFIRYRRKKAEKSIINIIVPDLDDN